MTHSEVETGPSKERLIVITCIGVNIDGAHSYMLSYINPYNDHFNTYLRGWESWKLVLIHLKQ